MTATQHKTTYLRVEIEALGVAYRLTNWSGFINGFQSIPTMEMADLSKISGTLADETAKILLPASTDVVQALDVEGLVTNATIKVSEVEVEPDAVSVIKSTVIFGGEIRAVVSNYRNKKSQAALLCDSTKSRTEHPLGVACSGTCPWRVGRGPCTVDLEPFTFPVTVTSFDSETMQVIATGGPGAPADLFTRGRLELDGVRVGVRFWSADAPAVFYVNRPVPSEWVGQTVSAVGGCDNSLEDCTTIFDNEDEFGGIGRKMLDYDPNFQTGGPNQS